MRALILALAVACSTASPVLYVEQGPWSAYSSRSNSPAVIRIPEPGLRFSQPQFRTVASHVVHSAPVPLVQSVASPVVAPVPLVKSVASPVVASVPLVKVPVMRAAEPNPLLAPEPPMPTPDVPFVGGQFHTQDEAGQYSFGHWGGSNTRLENRDFAGRTSGSFAYVDSEGDVQIRKYAAGAGSGFKVAASDLPVDTPTVAQVKAAHANAHADVKAMITK